MLGGDGSDNWVYGYLYKIKSFVGEIKEFNSKKYLCYYLY